MCSLYGFLDYQNRLSARRKNEIINTLAVVCEARGKDAAGIAYNAGGNLHVFKRGKPAHRLHFHIPAQSRAVMGHTRLTTQGDAHRNRNNHPFLGLAGGRRFALAHNGIIRNDLTLRVSHKLPATNIETDSYIAVQLLEEQGDWHMESLQRVAEALEGSFTLTLLSEQDDLLIVKGDSPLCLYDCGGFYLYASTGELLDEAVTRLEFQQEGFQKVELSCGDILRIDKNGVCSWDKFHTDKLFCSYRGYYGKYISCFEERLFPRSWLKEIYTTAHNLGIDEDDIDLLMDCGYSEWEVEALLCDPVGLRSIVNDLLCEGICYV